MDFFFWIVMLFVLGMSNFFIGMNAMGGFLREHRSIRDRRDLDDFRRMVRVQMYQALLQLVILGAMTVITVVGILMDRLGFFQFLAVLALNGVVWLAGSRGKKVEHRAQKLKVEDLDLQDEYRQVCRTWNSKPLPDF